MPTPLNKDVCNEQLFSKLYGRYSKDLHDFIYYKYGEEFDPEDKVHEAFIKLWRNCRKVSPDKARSYLFTVINNLTLNDIKHRKVVLRFQKTIKTDRTAESPQFVLEEKEYLEKFQTALANLPEKQRVAFMMNRVEGKRHKEIAEILNISRKAVEKRIYSALEKLRTDIEGI